MTTRRSPPETVDPRAPAERAWSRLQERARQTPTEPWLFFPVGWEWRWLSWSEGIEGASELGRGLEAALVQGGGGGAERSPAFVLSPQPSAATLLLALWGRGRRSLAGWSAAVTPEHPDTRRIDWPDAPRRVGEMTAPVLPAVGARTPDVTAAEWCLDLASAPPPGRDVVFFAGSLAEPAAWGLIDWAIVGGAALAIEPAAAAAAGSATWVGPSVLWLDDDLDSALSSSLDSARRARRRGVLRRLRAVVAESLPTTSRKRWQELGIETVARDRRS